MRLRLVTFVVLPLHVLVPSVAWVQERGRTAALSPSRPAVSVGEKVITRYAKPLKVGSKSVDDGTAFRVYRVAATKGKWLWLESGPVGGWVEAADVLPYSHAADHFTRQITANPKAAAAYICRGIVRQAKGDLDSAVADYSEAIRLDPKLALAYCNRGLARQGLQDHEGAVSDYSEAIRLDPKGALAHRARGSAWHAMREYDRAIADYDQALRLSPRHALAHLNRGLAWYAKRAFDRAIADFSEAIRADPESAAAYGNRACARHDKKDYAEAIADYQEAIRLAPNDGLAHNNLAWLRATCPEARHRDGKLAVEAATRACELTEWSNWRCLQTLAAACAEAGDFEKAIEHSARSLWQVPPEHKARAEETLEAYKARKPLADNQRLPMPLPAL